MIRTLTRRFFTLALAMSAVGFGLMFGRGVKQLPPRPVRTEVASPRPTRSGFPPTVAPGTAAFHPDSAGTAAGVLPPRPAVPSIPRPPRGKMISLVYGGNRQGEIEPCG